MAKKQANETWYCLRHPRSNKEIRVMSKRAALKWQNKGFIIADVIDPVSVSKRLSDY